MVCIIQPPSLSADHIHAFLTRDQQRLPIVQNNLRVYLKDFDENDHSYPSAYR